MSNFDRQIANALDAYHRELFGGRGGVCQWYYHGVKDIYHCPHTAIFGKDLMARMPNWSSSILGDSPAKVEWDSTPESEHKL